MELHFVTAGDGTPLTKSFTLEPDGSYSKTSYPHVKRVNSSRVEVNSPAEFVDAIKAAAERHAFLLTGLLDRDLCNESRAGRILRDRSSEWVVFDLDAVKGIDTLDQFVSDVLPAPFHDVSYIVQSSCSSGIVGSELRAHIFFLLGEPIDPHKIKLWLTETNIENSLLSSQLALSAGGGSLKFPLDRVANDHGRAVFIAPPVCSNFTDPCAGERIHLVTKSRDHVAFKFESSSKEVIRRKEREVIQRLRDEQSLPRKTLKTKSYGDFDVLLNADEVVVTESWEGNGYIHANLNGGDSGAYWVDPKHPKYIHNFKGEPSLILRDVAPDWWEKIKHLCITTEMLVFRDQISGRHYVGRYDAAEDRYLELDPIRKYDIKDWAEYVFGAAPPDPIPQYNLRFDPTHDKVVDRANQFVNEFQPTEYMCLNVSEAERYEMPPAIRKLMNHLVGNDKETLDWFVNWLACIFQYRKKTQTAIVLHGVPGTGKGLLFNRVLRPLFGAYAQAVQLEQMSKDMFNGFLGGSLLVQIEEAKANPEMRNRLFHWIADEQITLRKMYQEGKQQETYCNFIVVSNQLDAVKIEDLDRRFTVAPRQEQPLQDQPDGRKGIMSDEEIDSILPTEIRAFAQYLMVYAADLDKARRPLENEAKKHMRAAGMTVTELFVDAVKRGDIVWFLERIKEGGTSLEVAGQKTAVQQLVNRYWIPYVNSEAPCPVAKAHLQVVYNFVAQKHPLGDVAFGNMLKNKGLAIPAKDRVTIDDQRKSGRMVSWKGDPAALADYVAEFPELARLRDSRVPEPVDDSRMDAA